MRLRNITLIDAELGVTVNCVLTLNGHTMLEITDFFGADNWTLEVSSQVNAQGVTLNTTTFIYLTYE